MKKFKITFFNPVTLKKNVKKLIFKFDYNNHEWDYTLIDIFGEHTNSYKGNPENLINHIIDCCKRNGEYVTVKTFK